MIKTAKFSYLSSTPKGYRCSFCRTKGVRLWRYYQTFLSGQKLFCKKCALQDQQKSIAESEQQWKQWGGVPPKSDCIGWLVPAVPTEDGETFWGYTSVPQTGVLWWQNLPEEK